MALVSCWFQTMVWYFTVALGHSIFLFWVWIYCMEIKNITIPTS
jgi:hypothetical protein